MWCSSLKILANKSYFLCENEVEMRCLVVAVRCAPELAFYSPSACCAPTGTPPSNAEGLSFGLLNLRNAVGAYQPGSRSRHALNVLAAVNQFRTPRGITGRDAVKTGCPRDACERGQQQKCLRPVLRPPQSPPVASPTLLSSEDRDSTAKLSTNYVGDALARHCRAVKAVYAVEVAAKNGRRPIKRSKTPAKNRGAA